MADVEKRTAGDPEKISPSPAIEYDSSSDEIGSTTEVYDSSRVDPVLAKKMALVNAAIDEIGMTPFQWKLFFFNGFGYAVDSLLIVCQSIAQPAVDLEFGRPVQKIAGVALASQIGLLFGAAIWGFTADIIGRKLAFNSSLLICAAFVLIAGGMPDYYSFSTMVAIYSAGAGGNYILDATNLLEFLPFKNAWLVTFMSIWWAVGYTITGLFAWAFMSNYSCPSTATGPAECPKSENWGWRYLHFTSGSLVLVLSVARLLFVRMKQTPRWLVAQNRDADAFKVLQDLATQYKRPLSLRLEDLETEGRVLHTEKSRWSSLRLWKHVGGLFETRLLAWSTTVIIANWFVIGMVSPLYTIFLPYYLATRGADVYGTPSNYTTWRNYAINQIAGLGGPIIAGILVEMKIFGRRGTLAFGALLTMILQFGYRFYRVPIVPRDMVFAWC
ncbi:hypothetical protein N0V90_012508 [Kalmusia sp. IMI 367209]|nr:hypothetical protein N0V90_012508 [Kalmusia sp. IMI 367209]